MTLLAIDTSGHELGVGILRDTGDRFIHIRGDREVQKQSLYDVLCSLSEQYELSLDEVSRCIVSAGPGSFTGLRVSYAFAKGFCMPRRALFKPLSTHRAASIAVQGENVSLILGYAGRKECFCSAYAEDGTVLFEHQVIAVSVLEQEVVKRLGHRDFQAYFYGRDILDTQIGYQEIGAAEIVHGLMLGSEMIDWDAVSFDILELSSESPRYVRSVNAKTIAEREALKIKKTIA